jgi:hypothetical protein
MVPWDDFTEPLPIVCILAESVIFEPPVLFGVITFLGDAALGLDAFDITLLATGLVGAFAITGVEVGVDFLTRVFAVAVGFLMGVEGFPATPDLGALPGFVGADFFTGVAFVGVLDFKAAFFTTGLLFDGEAGFCLTATLGLIVLVAFFGATFFGATFFAAAF